MSSQAPQTFAERVAKIKARAARIDLPRALMVGGAVAIVLGFGLILLAWYGAAHTPFLFEQVPYMISGGLLGLGLVFLGAFLYFAFWLSRLILENRTQSKRTADLLDKIHGLLASGAVFGAAAEAGAPGSTNGEFVVTEKGTLFHRRDCMAVAGREDLRQVSAESGLEPCKVCDPLGTVAN
jgi:hypothetical protein